MITSISLNSKEKALVWETLNRAAMDNQQKATTTGDTLRKELYKARNETLLKIAALFTPGASVTTIQREDY